MRNTKKITLYEICLITMILMSEIKKIYLFQQYYNLFSFVKYIEIAMYLVLICIIAKKQYTAKQLIVIATLVLILGIGFLKTRNTIFLRGLLVIVAAKGVPYEKIVNTMFITIMSVFILTVLMYSFGLSNATGFRRNGVALGYIHPNQTAQVTMILSLLWLMKKNKSVSTKQVVLLYTINILITIITGSRTPFLILLIMPILLYIINKSVFRNGIISKLSAFIQLVLVLLTVISGIFYQNSRLIVFLDKKYFNIFNTFTGRIFLNWYAFKTYGFSLFGRIIDFKNATYTIDNSYAVSLMSMGILPTIIFMCGFVFTVRKAIKEKNVTLIAVSVGLGLYGFCEASMLDVFNNFIYLYLMTTPNIINKSSKGETKC